MLTPQIGKIFVIHYDKLVERKKYIKSFFNENFITNYEFRNLWQRDSLTDVIKNSYFKLNNLNNAQICVTIEHIETYRNILENCADENKWFLILEDDAIFCDNFVNNLNFYMNCVPEDAEYLDINDYSKLNSESLWSPQNATRTTCSYLIKKQTCKKILSTIVPFNHAIDHELNTQFRIHNIKNYWSNNSLIHHGSGSTYKSSYVYY